MKKTIKHLNILRPNPGPNKKEYNYFFFACRGCTISNWRKNLWCGFNSSNSHDDDNSYLTFEEEPDNEYDPNAIMVVCRGEFFGTVGYVGKEYTSSVKEILNKCTCYRIDVSDKSQIGQKEVPLILVWK